MNRTPIMFECCGDQLPRSAKRRPLDNIHVCTQCGTRWIWRCIPGIRGDWYYLDDGAEGQPEP